MRRVLWLSLAGLLLFILFVVARIPAEQLTSRLPARLQVEGVSGTLWSGQARQLTWEGMPLGRLHWDWQPTSLVNGEMAYAIQLTEPGHDLQAVVAQALDGSQSLRNTRLQLNAEQLQPWLPTRDAQPRGQIDLVMPAMRLVQGWPQSGHGTLQWREAALAGALPMSLGSLVADLQVQDGRITAVLSDNAGPLELGGTAELGSDRVYRVDAQLRARADADDNLRTSLSLLGTPDVSGRYNLRLQGRL